MSALSHSFEPPPRVRQRDQTLDPHCALIEQVGFQGQNALNPPETFWKSPAQPAKQRAGCNPGPCNRAQRVRTGSALDVGSVQLTETTVEMMHPKKQGQPDSCPKLRKTNRNVPASVLGCPVTHAIQQCFDFGSHLMPTSQANPNRCWATLANGRHCRGGPEAKRFVKRPLQTHQSTLAR